MDSPPAADPYTAIKERLLRAYILSEFEQGQRLIDSPLLGEDKPSVLMSKMTALIARYPPTLLPFPCLVPSMIARVHSEHFSTFQGRPLAGNANTMPVHFLQQMEVQFPHLERNPFASNFVAIHMSGRFFCSLLFCISDNKVGSYTKKPDSLQVIHFYAVILVIWTKDHHPSILDMAMFISKRRMTKDIYTMWS